MLNLFKKTLLLLTLLSLMACQSTTQVSPTPENERPNIVIFLVDDMGLMDTSVPFITDKHGNAQKWPLNEWYRTPNMEELARQGTRFSQFYAQSVCSPTRASLLTGQNATRHHTTTWIMPTQNNRGQYGPKNWNWKGLTSESITFPKLLQDSGYATIHIGKGHFGPLNSEGADPTNAGFDVNIAGGAWGRPKSYYGRDHYGNHPKYQSEDKQITHNIPHLKAYYQNDVYLSEALTQEAKKQIAESVQAQKPFLLFLSHYAVHAPFHSDPRFAGNYISHEKPQKARAFATLVEGIDKSLGDIVSQLKLYGVAKNTLILFMGDNGSDAPLGGNNGIASSAPLRGKKGTSWEGGMRTPLIAAWAKVEKNHPLQQRFPIRAGAINTQIASVLDVFPTVLAASSVDKPASHTIDGVNLASQLDEPNAGTSTKEFLMHFPHEHRHSYFTVFRQDDWKLIYQYNPDNKREIKRYQLFNLSEDPSESHNLSASHHHRLVNMMALMNTRLKEQGAQFPVEKSGKAILPEMPVSNVTLSGSQ